MVYETPDGSRIGFQMYNMLGSQGRKIEVAVGNARLANTLQYNLGSDSYVPLRLEGNLHRSDQVLIINLILVLFSFPTFRSRQKCSARETGILLCQWSFEGVTRSRWKWYSELQEEDKGHLQSN